MALDHRQRDHHDQHRDSEHPQVRRCPAGRNHHRTRKRAGNRTEPAERERRCGAGGTHTGRINIRTQREHRRLNRVDKQSVHAKTEDQQAGVIGNIHAEQQQRARRATRATENQRPTRAGARNHRGAQQRTQHATQVVRGEPRTRHRYRQALRAQHDRHRIARQTFAEQCGKTRVFLDGLFARVGKYAVACDRTRHPPKQAFEFLPAVRVPGEKARRLGQREDQQHAERERQHAADHEQRAPSIRQQNFVCEQSRHHAAERHADNRRRDGQGAAASRRKLRGHGGRTRQRAANAEAGDKTQHGNRHDAGRRADTASGGTEHQHAADHRPAAAKAVGQQSGARTADAHADQTGRDHRRKSRACNAPFLDQHGNCKTDQLTVEPVQHDRQRREQHHDLLHGGVRTFVERTADVDRVTPLSDSRVIAGERRIGRAGRWYITGHATVS
ncbi:hypothetical protein KCU90_g805, partial [Aureobasidium melanogenum]